ncbi:XtrA/YqaO family protein [Bacillus glycinifermentans]|uniref:XtrA/YqaO family protein n=1 Tax=Bacillus TaxID=1386 RepID=UPI001C238593|nr:XtrA/YqaO family protein [Bacillus glycinifermentans]
MKQPETIEVNKDFTFTGTIEPGKVRVIVLDGNEGTAHIMDAPEHGKTIIQTARGYFSRVDREIGHKIK